MKLILLDQDFHDGYAPSESHSRRFHTQPYPAKLFNILQDRVEASPEQMARCSAKAETFSDETGTLTRVVGWYHSHPHITVLPSHVDVRTQAMYQMLDPGFIGVIISTFNEVLPHSTTPFWISNLRSTRSCALLALPHLVIQHIITSTLCVP